MEKDVEEPESLMDLICNGRGLGIAGVKKPSSGRLFPYKAVMCPRCGRIQVTQGEEMFRCRMCGKVSRYRRKGQWNVVLKDFPAFEDAMIEAKRWALEEARRDEKRG